MYYATRILAAATAVVLAGAAWFSIRLAIADYLFRRGTPESVARALEMFPNNTAYLELRALQMDYANQDAAPLLERAARLNPLASAPRIRLGLAAESRGDAALAEKWLLDAARVDRQYEPRWTLAGFYFRQGRTDDFWKWIRGALELSYGDRRPAFDLCWRTAKSPEEILSRAIPKTPDVLAAYLLYVMDQHRHETSPVALELATLHVPAYASLLEAACDLVIDAGKAADAAELWRRLGHHAAGLLTNGDFAEQLGNHGFDWRVIPQKGVTHAQLTPSVGHRIVLSGMQPAACDLLRQYVILEPGKRYRLQWQARTGGLESMAGIEWTAGNSRMAIASTTDWRAGSVAFTAQSALASIALEYRRLVGQARAQGFVEIRGVSLSLFDE